MQVPYAQQVLGQGVRYAVESLKRELKRPHALAVALACALLTTVSLGLCVWLDRGAGAADRPAAIVATFGLAAIGAVLILRALMGALRTSDRRQAIPISDDGAHEDTSTIIGKDGVTGLLDRRAFLVFADDALAYYHRYDRRFATLLVQVDERPAAFREPKMLDCVLRHVADVLDLSLRKTDKVSRFGGEQFAILLREITERDAVMLADRMRARVESFAAAFGGHSIPVTVTMGLTLARREDKTVGELLARTESFLDEARRRGPNTVVWQSALDHDPGATSATPERAGALASLACEVALLA